MYGPIRAPASWTFPAASGEAAGPDTWSLTLALPEESARMRASERMAGSGASAAISRPSLGLQRLLTVPWAETLTPSPSTRKSRIDKRDRSKARSASRAP